MYVDLLIYRILIDPFELIGEDPVLQFEWSDDRQRASNFVYAQKATISADQKLALLNSLGYPSWEDVFYNLWHPSVSSFYRLFQLPRRN
jgi:hypothetical protein